eukprot:CAMPEP_0197045144 /NCGR_PEP_ID=MMETSP1384-20130603/21079_1 /TAXON_ID=29189 /ORGANISM="Ammonia sp." /LENGTH=111 /DNA_ID=CAMNT_0042476713 /DNA_START=12 /DNA_END=347 /DNA_ORIENTATION=-
MWLDNIHEVDARWPKDDSDECVVFLHRLRTKQLLKNVIQEIGDANFAALCKKYRVDQTCGFDLNEVVTGEHTLIVRKQNNAENENENEDDDDDDEDDDVYDDDDDSDWHPE